MFFDRNKTHKYQTTGFSLVEVMVVLVIIGMLAAVVTIGTRHYLVSAKQNTARTEIATMVQAVETFYIAYHRYPSSSEGLSILLQSTERISEPLLKQPPIDPWDNPYLYIVPGTNAPYEIVSFGADGRQGGDGSNADIGSSNLKNAAP